MIILNVLSAKKEKYYSIPSAKTQQNMFKNTVQRWILTMVFLSIKIVKNALRIRFPKK